MRVDPQFTVRGAAPTVAPFRGEFTRFVERFSDDQLAIVWKFSGIGFDPETQQVAPYPGRETFVKFLRPIPGSWRDILRRAVRTMGNRPELSALRALLSVLLSGYVPPVAHPAPSPRALSPQERCHRFTPVRGSPVMTLHMRPVMPGAPPT
jgi:hypothetical protein